MAATWVRTAFRWLIGLIIAQFAFSGLWRLIQQLLGKNKEQAERSKRQQRQREAMQTKFTIGSSTRPGEGLPRTTSTRRGRKDDANEDVIFWDTRTCTATPKQYAVFGVFDGHAGNGAAKFASTYLIENLKVTSSKKVDVQEGLRDAFLETEDALRTAQATINNAEERASSPEHSGTTATIAVVIDDKLFVANVGNSRAILYSKNPKSGLENVTQITVNHTIDNGGEISRILRSNALVAQMLEEKQGGWPRLTRSLGDFSLKNETDNLIIAEPYVSDELSLATPTDSINNSNSNSNDENVKVERKKKKKKKRTVRSGFDEDEDDEEDDERYEQMHQLLKAHKRRTRHTLIIATDGVYRALYRIFGASIQTQPGDLDQDEDEYKFMKVIDMEVDINIELVRWVLRCMELDEETRNRVLPTTDDEAQRVCNLVLDTIMVQYTRVMKNRSNSNSNSNNNAPITREDMSLVLVFFQ